MKPEEAARLLQAYADGELDPATSLEMEAQLAASPALRAALERTRAMSAAIREKADYHAPPAALAARIRASLPEAKGVPARKLSWQLFAAAAGVAVLSLVALVVRPDMQDRITEDLLASHGRATLGGRMIDVASSDLHTVKPWLSARLPYSPPVGDLAAQGFPLAGGRVDYVGGKPVAVLVYTRRKHTVEAFVWPEDSGRSLERMRAGLNLESFVAGGMRYWLVSDLSADELGQLARLLGRS
jgi:anti-sigma factor RsiW